MSKTKVVRKFVQRSYSFEEKRNYFMAWQSSNQSKVQFCKENNISEYMFYKWSKLFTEIGASEFTAVTIKEDCTSNTEDLIAVEFKFPNQLKLNISIHRSQLIILIKELSYAPAII